MNLLRWQQTTIVLAMDTHYFKKNISPHTKDRTHDEELWIFSQSSRSTHISQSMRFPRSWVILLLFHDYGSRRSTVSLLDAGWLRGGYRMPWPKLQLRVSYERTVFKHLFVTDVMLRGLLPPIHKNHIRKRSLPNKSLLVSWTQRFVFDIKIDSVCVCDFCLCFSLLFWFGGLILLVVEDGHARTSISAVDRAVVY